MSRARLILLVFASSFCSSGWGQQTAPPATNPASDPQAVAVVQAAITALGGAAAISRPQSWTFQAQMRGPYGNDVSSYSMSTDTDTGHFTHASGAVTSMPMTRSHFVPAVAGSILLNESQDPEFTMQYASTSSLDSKVVTVIKFWFGSNRLPAQTWYFDSSNLPVQIVFQLPATVGVRKSFFGTVALSDFRAVSGTLYPFKIVEISDGGVPEIITLQSVAPTTDAPPNTSHPEGGDSR